MSKCDFDMRRIFSLFLPLFFAFPLAAQTIAEKKAGLTHQSSDLDRDTQILLTRVNQQLSEKQNELRNLYAQVALLYSEKAPSEAYQQLLNEINDVRDAIVQLEEHWRQSASTKEEKDDYALWHQPETTIEQLVMDFGSQEFVYLIPSEIGIIELSLASNIPIPRSSWGQMLEQILMQNGVGIQQLNPFLRELYPLGSSQANIKLITNKRQDLEIFPPDARVSFVLSPEPSDVRRSWYFLEKFVNSQSTSLQLIGRDILIVGRVIDVKELLRIYDFVSSTRGDRDYKVMPLRRVDPEEMAKILESIFGEFSQEPDVEEVEVDSKVKGKQKKTVRKGSKNSGNGLSVFTMGESSNSIFLIGTREEIRRAQQIVREVESQIGEAREKVIYRYQVKNSDPEELGNTLQKIYTLMVESGIGRQRNQEEPLTENDLRQAFSEVVGAEPPPEPPIITPYQIPLGMENMGIPNSLYGINTLPVEPSPPIPREVNVNRENFIVDLKTGTIVMVVEADILPKLKELLKKIDVPKKMVHIDVMLFEKRLDRTTNFGLNLLRMGAQATQTTKTSVSWNEVLVNGQLAPEREGLFQFLVSRAKDGLMPAYDLIYNFIIGQSDVTLNACPSVVAINQTPATLSITDEISINTGIYFFDTAGSTVPQQSFQRVQYGITITITPTIHAQDYDEEEEFMGEDSVTLLTDIVFDSFRATSVNRDRPDINRRKVKNEVRIVDGQTVIIGGLRNKQSEDQKESIPFLGEIPGVGKLFSNTFLEDRGTEMFVFITPRIIRDPRWDMERIRNQEMCKRPGDIPEFLCRLNAALNGEKYRAFQGTLTFLFGRMQERCICPDGEWNGR